MLGIEFPCVHEWHLVWRKFSVLNSPNEATVANISSGVQIDNRTAGEHLIYLYEVRVLPMTTNTMFLRIGDRRIKDAAFQILLLLWIQELRHALLNNRGNTFAHRGCHREWCLYTKKRRPTVNFCRFYSVYSSGTNSGAVCHLGARLPGIVGSLIRERSPISRRRYSGAVAARRRGALRFDPPPSSPSS